ncbi:MAG: D-alanine--D-alanine ligase [SAR324 cluster bacterium]|nr:D-alanine--D-alanine ligase [SAR324 cluster bacterium]
MTGSDKITIGLICGGQGLEHEVDLFAVKELESAFDRNRYELVLLGVDKSGVWHFALDSESLLTTIDNKIALNPSLPIVIPRYQGQLIDQESQSCLAKVDLFFPVADDPLQSFLQSLDVPYVGADSYGSAIARDKDVTKRLLRDHGFPIIPYLTLRSGQTVSFHEVSQQLGLPLFVKACRLGSSIGVFKVTEEEEFNRALKEAFTYDRKVLIEQAIEGREIECAVLGNEFPQAAEVLGEITQLEGFFTFEAKYLSNHQGQIQIPALLEDHLVQKMREAAVSAFVLLECEGLARIDFFLKPDGSFVILEINSSPGLSKHLMYSKLWEFSNVSHNELLDRLIKLAMDRYQQVKKLRTTPGDLTF